MGGLFGGQRVCWPPLKLLGGGGPGPPWPPHPTPMSSALLCDIQDQHLGKRNSVRNEKSEVENLRSFICTSTECINYQVEKFRHRMFKIIHSKEIGLLCKDVFHTLELDNILRRLVINELAELKIL